MVFLCGWPVRAPARADRARRAALDEGWEIAPETTGATELDPTWNGSSLHTYVQSAPLRSAAASSCWLRAISSSWRRRCGAGGGVSDAAGRPPQCGGGDPGLWLLCAVSYRHRLIAGVRRHGTVPAYIAKTEVGPRRSRANSSAGSERLPYTQDVGGSNPSSPICTPRDSAGCSWPTRPSCWEVEECICCVWFWSRSPVW